MMSLDNNTNNEGFKSLPPVWEAWTRKDYERLTLEEVELLYASLYRKLYDIEVEFVEQTCFCDRNTARILALNKERNREEKIIQQQKRGKGVVEVSADFIKKLKQP